ncbi:MAG: dihydroorotate dehydrogenase, partial [Archaeoglobi archaeon]|nr:dihydroorotate dehydrogenase [Candidatus Mnemosynella sp.]
MGLPNPGCLEFREEIRKFKESSDAPIIASIFGESASEIRRVAEILKDADGFEINVSCPHHEATRRLEDDPEAIERIVREVKRATESPVWVKLSPNVSSIVEIGEAAQKGGADAVVAINTLRAMVIDVESGRPVLGNKFGGLSGACIKPVAVRCIYELYEALEIPIIGVGGVSSHRDVIEMMLAGASAVQIGTAVMKDAFIFKKIEERLRGYLEKRSMRIEELVGGAHRV